MAEVVSLVEDPVPRFLLLDVDETSGKQTVISLIAYGEDPDDPNSTLIFALPPDSINAYHELRINLPFSLFGSMIEGSAHVAINNLNPQATHIDPNSDLGQFITGFKTLLLRSVSSPGGVQ